MSEEEHVLCFPSSELDRLGRFQGYSRDMKYLELLSSPLLLFQPRSAVETDSKFKQLIPYHIIYRDGEILSYVRTKQSGEERLRQKRSVGIGGHINLTDINRGLLPADTTKLLAKQGVRNEVYYKGAARELAEEIIIASQLQNEIIGFINDERDLVGQVHFGVVHLVAIGSWGGVEENDSALALDGFRTATEVKRFTDIPLEGWSQLVLDCGNPSL